MTVRPDRGKTLSSAPLVDLLTILLRQFKRPLAAFDLRLDDAQAAALARQIAEGSAAPDQRETLRKAMLSVIAESEHVLARWKLTFEESLNTPMEDIPGWETTAEFLEIANEKTNAELRIAAGSALLTALGDRQHAEKILVQIARDPKEPEAQIGRRLLSFAAHIDPKAPDWLAQARAWIAG